LAYWPESTLRLAPLKRVEFVCEKKLPNLWRWSQLVLAWPSD